MRPLPAARQQATLLLSQRMLSLGSWSLSTALQRRLAPDRLEPSEAGNATELRLAQALLARQHAVINFFYHQFTGRVLANAARLNPVEPVFSLAQLYVQLDSDVGAEPASVAAPAAPLAKSS